MLKKICPKCGTIYDSLDVTQCSDCETNLFYQLSKNSISDKIKSLFFTNKLEKEIKSELNQLNEWSELFDNFKNINKIGLNKFFDEFKVFNDEKDKFKYLNHLSLDENLNNDLFNSYIFLSNSNNFFEKIHNAYYSSSDKEKLKEEYNDILSIQKKHGIKADKLNFSFDDFIEKANEEFIERELVRYNLFFKNIDGKSLDENQRRSIVIDEDNMQIIAGAGCGKTLTISGKVNYLLDKGVKPSEILCLSYSKASAEDLFEKLPENVKSSTFHALGKGILKENLGHDPHIEEELLDEIINDIFTNNILENKKLLEKIMDYFLYYSYDVANYENKNLGEILEIEEGRYFKTLRETYPQDTEKRTFKNNQKVKSFEELIIANFLFIHGINYEYEKQYKDSKGNKVESWYNYKPDFYLTDYGIYLEHFGVNRNLDAPWLDKKHSDDYKNKIFEKREFHKKHGTKLIETYSYYASENILTSKLQEILEKENVEIKEVNYEEILEVLAKNDKLNSLKPLFNLIKSFINLFKGNNYDSSKFDEFIKQAEKEPDAFLKKRHILFLNIVKEIYIKYEKALEESQSIDFDDMINDATELINQNKVSRNYKYIIVDEYQDISHSRFKLLKALQKASKAKIFVVGDDWQSIYRFTGCDVSLFTNFKNYFSDYERCYINNTYRNSQSLIDIAGKFIAKNPNQLDKDLNSKQSGNIKNPIKIAYYKDRDDSSKINALEKCVQDITKSSNNILILGRYNKSIKHYIDNKTFKVKSKNPMKINYTKNPSLDITFLTAHSSKGLEEDNVILLDLENDYMGFPSKREDDSVLKYVINEGDDYDLAEERRLFYVAITRTKKYNYFLVNENKPSQFVEELEDFGDFDVIERVTPDLKNDRIIKTKLKCPICKTGNVSILKINDKVKKFICSHRSCEWDGGFYNGKFNDLDLLENCPNCDGILHIKYGKKGPIGTCSNYGNTKCEYGEQLNGKFNHLIEEFEKEKSDNDKSSKDKKSGKVKKYNKKKSSVSKNKVKSVGKCPECGNDLVKRNGKFGEFIGCTSFPKCRYTCNVDELD